MKRFLSSALVLGVFWMPAMVLSGCGEESKVETTTKIKTPEGTSTEKDTKSISTTGSNPPVTAPK